MLYIQSLKKSMAESSFHYSPSLSTHTCNTPNVSKKFERYIHRSVKNQIYIGVSLYRLMIISILQLWLINYHNVIGIIFQLYRNGTEDCCFYGCISLPRDGVYLLIKINYVRKEII